MLAAALVFIVTTTADSGPGSLRQALLDANAACMTTSCNIAIQIPGPPPPSGFFTIRPQSPLPAARFAGVIDATTQAAARRR